VFVFYDDNFTEIGHWIEAAPNRIKVFDDFKGGVAGGVGGAFSRNAHEWDVAQ
jgi:hypothetical protein